MKIENHNIIQAMSQNSINTMLQKPIKITSDILHFAYLSNDMNNNNRTIHKI